MKILSICFLFISLLLVNLINCGNSNSNSNFLSDSELAKSQDNQNEKNEIDLLEKEHDQDEINLLKKENEKHDIKYMNIDGEYDYQFEDQQYDQEVEEFRGYLKDLTGPYDEPAPAPKGPVKYIVSTPDYVSII